MNRRRIVILAVAVTLLVGMAAPAVAQDSGYQHEEAEQVDDNEMDDDVWSNVTFQHSASVTTHEVVVHGDYAYIALSSREGGENVVFTDSTRQTTGPAERRTATLESGQQVYRVPLENPSVKAMTIDTEGQMLVWIGEQDDDLPLNLTPELLPYVGVALGAVLVLIMIVGLDQFAKLTGGNTEVVR